jgi:hypothetical protein
MAICSIRASVVTTPAKPSDPALAAQISVSCNRRGQSLVPFSLSGSWLYNALCRHTHAGFVALITLRIGPSVHLGI